MCVRGSYAARTTKLNQATTVQDARQSAGENTL